MLIGKALANKTKINENDKGVVLKTLKTFNYTHLERFNGDRNASSFASIPEPFSLVHLSVLTATQLLA